MFCKYCGKENPDGVQFCSSCGQPIAANGQQQTQQQAQQWQAPPQAYYPQPQPVQPGNGMATASLVLGIIGLIIFPWAFICGTLGIIFGCIAKSNGNKTGKPTAGIVCGAIGIAIFIIFIVIAVIAAMSIYDNAMGYLDYYNYF